MVGSTFILINRNGRRTLLNATEIVSVRIEDIDLNTNRGKYVYGKYSPEQGTLYTVQLMFTSPREMEYIFATAAERDEFYDQLMAAVAPAVVIESTAPFVPVRPEEPPTEKKTYTKEEVYLTKEDFDRAVAKVFAQQQGQVPPPPPTPKPPRKSYTRKPRE